MEQIENIQGKTHAKLLANIHQTSLHIGDTGYIDGYGQAANHKAFAVFVRYSDGEIGLVPVSAIQAINWQTI